MFLKGYIMKLTFKTTEFENEASLKIKINDEIKTLDNLNNQASFELEENINYEVFIEQESSKNNINFVNILIFIITMLIRGAFNILLMNTESKWENNVNAYCIKSKFNIKLQQDLDVSLKLVNTKFYEELQTWELPKIITKPEIEIESHYIVNYNDFNNQFYSYVKRITSIFSVLLLVFCILIYFGNITTIIFSSILAGGISLLITIVILSQYKKLKKLKKLFLERNKKLGAE